jgi:hypothetical protein
MYKHTVKEGAEIARSTCWTAERLEFESRYGEAVSPLHVFQTDSGVNPASYSGGTLVRSPWVNRPGREADYSSRNSAGSKISGLVVINLSTGTT